MKIKIIWSIFILCALGFYGYKIDKYYNQVILYEKSIEYRSNKINVLIKNYNCNAKLAEDIKSLIVHYNLSIPRYKKSVSKFNKLIFNIDKFSKPLKADKTTTKAKVPIPMLITEIQEMILIAFCDFLAIR